MSRSSGKRFGDLLHGVGIGAVERRAVGGRVGGIALRQRGDQRLLLVAGLRGKRLGLADRGKRRLERRGLHRPLMFGPSTSASPQKHMAQLGSSCCAARKLRRASQWLKP